MSSLNDENAYNSFVCLFFTLSEILSEKFSDFLSGLLGADFVNLLKNTEQ